MMLLLWWLSFQMCASDSFSLFFHWPSLRMQLTFTEAMRNKARLSITGSVGENGRVLTPDCPKAVHSGPSLRQTSGLALVSSDLPWKPKTFKCLKRHKNRKRTSENLPYSNDANTLSNRADKEISKERNRGPSHAGVPGVPPQDIWRTVIPQTVRLLRFSNLHSKNLRSELPPLQVKQTNGNTGITTNRCLAKRWANLLVLTLCHKPCQTGTLVKIQLTQHL